MLAKHATHALCGMAVLLAGIACSDPNSWRADVKKIGLSEADIESIAPFIRALQAKSVRISLHEGRDGALTAYLSESPWLADLNQEAGTEALAPLAHALNLAFAYRHFHTVRLESSQSGRAPWIAEYAHELITDEAAYEDDDDEDMDAFSLYKTGIAFLSHDTAWALSHFHEGVGQDPRFSGNYLELIRVLTAQGSLEEAETVLSRARQYLANDVETWISDARIALALNDLPRASAALDAASALNPHHEEYIALQVRYNWALGRTREACGFLTLAEVAENRDIDALRTLLGSACANISR